MIKSNRYDTIDFFDYFSVLFQEMHLSIDETFLNRFLQFIGIVLNSYRQFNLEENEG